MITRIGQIPTIISTQSCWPIGCYGDCDCHMGNTQYEQESGNAQQELGISPHERSMSTRATEKLPVFTASTSGVLMLA